MGFVNDMSLFPKSCFSVDTHLISSVKSQLTFFIEWLPIRLSSNGFCFLQWNFKRPVMPGCAKNRDFSGYFFSRSFNTIASLVIWNLHRQNFTWAAGASSSKIIGFSFTLKLVFFVGIRFWQKMLLMKTCLDNQTLRSQKLQHSIFPSRF